MAIDWNSWLVRWDAQQTGYLPEGEARFEAMLDVLEFTLPEHFLALDLACGPGAISQRLLKRFPEARYVANKFGEEPNIVVGRCLHKLDERNKEVSSMLQRALEELWNLRFLRTEHLVEHVTEMYPVDHPLDSHPGEQEGGDPLGHPFRDLHALRVDGWKVHESKSEEDADTGRM